MKRGQFVRLFISETSTAIWVIAAAKEMTLHISSQVEDSTTKDTTGDWVENEVTATSYDIQTNALVLSDDDTLYRDGMSSIAFGLEEAENWLDDRVLYWSINNVSGTNNRTKGSLICKGQCKATSLNISAQNKQNATYSVTFNGYGVMSLTD